MACRMIPPEEVCAIRTKLMDRSTTNLEVKSKDIPGIYRSSSLVLNFMKTRRFNLHEAIDAAVPEDQMPLIGIQVETLVRKTLDHEQEINFLIKKVKILEHCMDLNPFMVKILIAELLWGKYFIKFNTMDTIYVKYYEQDLREEFVEAATHSNNFEDSYVSKLPVYIRINTLTIPLENSINAFYREGWNLLPRPSTYIDFLTAVRYLDGQNYMRDFHISELFVFPPGTSFYQHPGYLEGKFLIQDKGSCLSTFLLNPKPGSRVLDLLAAPGIKTNHIANMIKNEGTIYACERNPERYNNLCTMMNLTNVKCAEPIPGECLDLKFDDINYILVDVPSTYSGIFDKKDLLGLNHLVRHFQFKSRVLLQFALQNFPNVKRVVFTTCSIFAEEGEKVVADALHRIDNSYGLLDAREMLWKEWISVGDTVEYPFAANCVRCRPEFDLCQGYFIAVFERNFSVPVPHFVRKELGKNPGFNNAKKVQAPKPKPKPKPIPKPLPKPPPKVVPTGKKEKKRPRKKKNKFALNPDVAQYPKQRPSSTPVQIQAAPVYYASHSKNGL